MKQLLLEAEQLLLLTFHLRLQNLSLLLQLPLRVLMLGQRNSLRLKGSRQQLLREGSKLGARNCALCWDGRQYRLTTTNGWGGKLGLGHNKRRVLNPRLRLHGQSRLTNLLINLAHRDRLIIEIDRERKGVLIVLQRNRGVDAALSVSRERLEQRGDVGAAVSDLPTRVERGNTDREGRSVPLHDRQDPEDRAGGVVRARHHLVA